MINTHTHIYKYVLYTIWDPVYVKVAGGFINICDFSSVKWHDDPNSLQPVMVCHGLLGCSSCRIHYEPWFAMIKRWWLYTHIYIDIRIYIHIYIYILHYIYIYIYITLEYSNPLTNREYEEFRLWDSLIWHICTDYAPLAAICLRSLGVACLCLNLSKILCKSISHWF